MEFKNEAAKLKYIEEGLVKKLKLKENKLEKLIQPELKMIQSIEDFQHILPFLKHFEYCVLDAEWNSCNFQSVREIAIVQITFPGGQCYLIQNMEIPKEFKEFLQNEEKLKIGIDILNTDKEKIKQQFGFTPKGRALVILSKLRSSTKIPTTT